MVRKRFTYAFNTFVHGKYDPSNSAQVLELFNSMTLAEKLDILSLDFKQLWYRIWLGATLGRAQVYPTAKSVFERAFVADGGDRLKRLLHKSTHHEELLWEVPKGRKRNKVESDVHCAVREFQEETGVSKHNYYLTDATRTHTFTDEGIKYVNRYYIAYTTKKIEPIISFTKSEQLDEISDIRWMSIEDIRYSDSTGRLERLIKPIFNYVKKAATI